MYQMIYDLLSNTWPKLPAAPLAYALTLAGIAVLCFVLRAALKGLTGKLAGRLAAIGKGGWIAALHKHQMFRRLANVVVPVVLSLFSESMPQYGNLLARAASVSGVAVFLLLADSFIKSADEVYSRHEYAKTRPLKSVFQVAEVAVIILGCVVALAALMNTSASVLLGGIGAMTAVTSFIFKDAILGFVAGIQLIVNDMIHIGDWIEVPKQAADGTVIELSMTTVKVQNFDKSITTIPAYTLVSGAFINWREMQDSGGRRIKRAIYIDAGGVRPCDDAMLRRLEQLPLLRPYLEEKQADIAAHNKALGIEGPDQVQGRRLTNLGTFRAYIMAYLGDHPGIHPDMTRMVRQLASDGRGIPLEIYAFTATVQWDDYENIQSDLFDHLYAVAGEFGLQIYQQPSGGDLRQLTASE